MIVLLLWNGPGHHVGPDSNIPILRSLRRITVKSRTLSNVSVQRRSRQRLRRCLCFSAVDAQTGPVVRYHQEVFVHGFTEPSSVQLWRNNGGHLSWKYHTAQKQQILIRLCFTVCERRSQKVICKLYLLRTCDFQQCSSSLSQAHYRKTVSNKQHQLVRVQARQIHITAKRRRSRPGARLGLFQGSYEKLQVFTRFKVWNIRKHMNQFSLLQSDLSLCSVCVWGSKMQHGSGASSTLLTLSNGSNVSPPSLT